MRGRAPSLALALALLAAALTAPSCVAVIGADIEPEPVVEALCACTIDNPGFDFQFDSDCETVIEERLRRATEDARAEWMKKYLRMCAQCTDDVVSCYRTEPTCSRVACDTTNECCEGMSCQSVNGKSTCVEMM
jgi:hypothetical protein